MHHYEFKTTWMKNEHTVYQKILTFWLKDTLCICKSTMRMIPLSFPLCEGLIPPEKAAYQQFSLYDHCPTSHLRLKIAVGETCIGLEGGRKDTDLVP